MFFMVNQFTKFKNDVFLFLKLCNKVFSYFHFSKFLKIEGKFEVRNSIFVHLFCYMWVQGKQKIKNTKEKVYSWKWQ